MTYVCWIGQIACFIQSEKKTPSNTTKTRQNKTVREDYHQTYKERLLKSSAGNWNSACNLQRGSNFEWTRLKCKRELILSPCYSSQGQLFYFSVMHQEISMFPFVRNWVSQLKLSHLEYIYFLFWWEKIREWQ